MKRILIVTAKLPNKNTDLDGGTSTVNQLISILSEKNNVDILFYNIYGIIQEPIEGVKNIICRDGSDLCYKDISSCNYTNKFESRIQMSENVAKEISKLIDNYEVCFVIHCSLAFMCYKYLNQEQLNRIILYPMFLTPSYCKSGNIVPDDYTKHEKMILNSVGKILTPSGTEKKQLIDIYGVDEGKIYVQPRSVGIFYGKYKNITENQIINIGSVTSFRNQKNVLESIKCIQCVLSKCNNVQFHIVGSVYQNSCYDECVKYIEENRLDEYVTIYNPMNCKNLKDFYNKMDIMISTSLYETFGRTIFEGMAMGLPTIVYDKLEVVNDYLGENEGIVFVPSYIKMAESILGIMNDSLKYSKMSKSALLVGEKFSFSNEKKGIENLI